MSSVKGGAPMEIPRRALAVLAACAKPDTAKLYATQLKAPSLEASAIEALDSLGSMRRPPSPRPRMGCRVAPS